MTPAPSAIQDLSAPHSKTGLADKSDVLVIGAGFGGIAAAQNAGPEAACALLVCAENACAPDLSMRYMCLSLSVIMHGTAALL